jgi:hypothetical protein
LHLRPEKPAHHTSTLMGKSPEERITPGIGREIAQRTGVKALLVGSIVGMVSQYVVTFDSFNSYSGDTFA